MPEIVLPAPGPHMVDKLAHPARHKILCMGRRWRKTTTGIIAAICGHGPNRERRGVLQGANVWFIDKTFPDAHSVWLEVRDILRPFATHISEVHRRVQVKGGGAITIKSAKNPDGLVGDIFGLDGVVMNEGAKFKPIVWHKSIRPALSERKGWSIWPSTPEGHNYFKELFDKARGSDAEGNENPKGLADWMRWHEPSSSNPFWDPEEIEASRREGMPENMIRQEYFAEFILMGPGRTYHEFERAVHLREFAVDHTRPVDLCIAFHSAPSAWVVCQGDRDNSPERALGEIRPEGSDFSIRAYVDAFRERFPRYGNGDKVRVFGLLGEKGAGRSDFELVRQLLPRARVYERMPEEKDRTNSVNYTLRDGYGDVRGYVSSSCERLIKDLEYTQNADASARIGKQPTPGTGVYAAAWGAKLSYVYPAVLETRRSQERERRFPTTTPEARAAHNAYWVAVRQGKIKRPDRCDSCGTIGPVQADHRDYGKPLDVTHLCPRCHAKMPPAGGTIQSSARH